MTGFLDLHRPGEPLLVPNPWDAGSARLFAALGFRALASTSSGAAAAAGGLDGSLGPAGTLAAAGAIVSATDLPVTADAENGFGADPAGVAAFVREARAIGLAGLSIEDFTGRGDELYPVDQAVERVAAAAQDAHEGDDRLVITARAEGFLHGEADLAAAIGRLQAYAAAGADVVYAPGLTTTEQVSTLVAEVERPVNVLVVPGLLSVAALAEVGVARISVGGAFAFQAYGTAVAAAREFLAGGVGWAAPSRQAAAAVRGLLDPPTG